MKKKHGRESIVLAALAAAHGGSYTPVQVQKLFFLIDRNAADLVGGPFFDFEPYNYGPFDAEVYRTLERLEARGLVEVTTDGRLKSYGLTADGLKRGQETLQAIDAKAAKYFVHVSDFVRSLSFSQLVSAIYKAYPEMKENSVFQS
ncbi:hypothetical protein [Candidatus Nitrospira bockiana]